jgi:hypothetical protein
MFRLRLRRAVLSYWVEHPGAKDTTEGIRLWWLSEWITLPYSMLREELETLARRGWVIERGTGDANPIFALNPVEIPSISAYLCGDAEEPDNVDR